MKITVHSVEQGDAETLLVTADIGAKLPDGSPHDAHPIYVPVAAIGSRMAMYELSTPLEALQAILREHYGRLNPKIENPATRKEARAQMQTLAKVEITGAALDEHVERNRAAIAAAHATRKSRT